jgi:cytoskeletal protein CcmA (bactofilin family)
MGKSSKPENTADNSYQPQESYNTSGNLYGTESVLRNEGKVVSESESMARDIKEGRLSGFVGHGTVLTGETNFQAMLRVDGHLTGKVGSDNGTLVIGTDGRVDADITVAAAVINGTVNGDIIATEKVELGRASRVVGNITTPQIVIEPGAVFEGSCHMLKAREARDERDVQAKNYIHTSIAPDPVVSSTPAVEEAETASEDETDEKSSSWLSSATA